MVTSSSTFARLARLRIVPLLAPLLFSSAALRRMLFRTISQVNVNYRGSRLSRGRVGPVHGGDRLPWVKTDLDVAGEGNFTPLKSLDWQLHLYGEAAPEVSAFAIERRLPLHIFPWRTQMQQSGLRCNALYLVRPDGYVAVAAQDKRTEVVRSYIAEQGLFSV
jgi:hypothetical protein